MRHLVRGGKDKKKGKENENRREGRISWTMMRVD
jgi:hypothetical protein